MGFALGAKESSDICQDDILLDVNNHHPTDGGIPLFPDEPSAPPTKAPVSQREEDTKPDTVPESSFELDSDKADRLFKGGIAVATASVLFCMLFVYLKRRAARRRQEQIQEMVRQEEESRFKDVLDESHLETIDIDDETLLRMN